MTSIEYKPKTTVCQFELYDINSDSWVKSQRWAEIETIKRLGGRTISGCCAQIEKALLDAEGMTERGFDPLRSRSSGNASP